MVIIELDNKEIKLIKQAINNIPFVIGADEEVRKSLWRKLTRRKRW